MVLFECRPVNLGVSAIFAPYGERVNVVKSFFEVVAFVAKTVIKQAFEGRNLRMVQPQPVALDFRRVQYDDLFGSCPKSLIGAEVVCFEQLDGGLARA